MNVLKPKFEQARSEALKSKKPMREADIVEIQAKLVEYLNHTGDLLVERAKRPNRTDPLLEITAAWMGPAASHEEVRKALHKTWSGGAFDGLTDVFHMENVEEVLHVRFLATSDDRYLTGKVLIRI